MKEEIMSDQLFPVPESWAKSAWIDNAKYLEMYEQSVKDPEGFWGDSIPVDRPTGAVEALLFQ